MRGGLARVIVVAALATGCDVDSFPPTVDSAEAETHEHTSVYRFLKYHVYWDQPAEAWTLATWPELEPVDAVVRSIEEDARDLVEVEASGLELRWYVLRLAPEEAMRVESSDGYRLADGSLVWFRDRGFVAEPDTMTTSIAIGDVLVTFSAPFVAADGGPVAGHVSLSQGATTCEDAGLDGSVGRYVALRCDGALDFTEPLHLSVREGLITEANGTSVPARELDFVALDEETGFYRFERTARPFPPVPSDLCGPQDVHGICE